LNRQGYIIKYRAGVASRQLPIAQIAKNFSYIAKVTVTLSNTEQGLPEGRFS
jgi:hypothetical protein